MCDIYHQLQKWYAERDKKMITEKFGYVLKVRIENSEDIDKLSDIIKDYYRTFGFDEVMIQMRQSTRKGGESIGNKEE